MGIKIRFSEDGMFVCASDMDGEIYVFQLDSKDIISRSENENAIVKCIWHPHDNQIVLLDGLGRIGTFPFLPFLSLFFPFYFHFPPPPPLLYSCHIIIFFI